MLSEKEKLEEELKLLEESLTLEVITKEEYEDAKQRIDGKLNELKQNKETVEKKAEVEEEPKEPKPEGEEPEIKKEEEKIEIKEIKEEEKIEEVNVTEEQKEEVKAAEEVKETEEKPKEDVKEEKAEVAEKKPAGEERIEEEKPVTVVEEKKKGSKIFVYIGIIIILGFVSGYFLFSGGEDDADTKDFSADIPVETVSFIACSSDDECEKEGSIGTCMDPGTEDSECTYIEDVKVELMVLNSNNCFNCETGRILSILNGFFPNIQTKNVDFETEEGKGIADEYGITALPAYILNSSLQEARDYYKFYNAFNKVEDSFVMKNTVSNANYYLNREEIPNKLDLFLKPGQSASLKAEENLEEFLEVFDGIVILEKHDSDSEIVEELGINIFPAFLVNNKIKFSGVQAADKIRENFCQVNSVTPCALGLSKSLV